MAVAGETEHQKVRPQRAAGGHRFGWGRDCLLRDGPGMLWGGGGRGRRLIMHRLLENPAPLNHGRERQKQQKSKHPLEKVCVGGCGLLPRLLGLLWPPATQYIQ